MNTFAGTDTTRVSMIAQSNLTEAITLLQHGNVGAADMRIRFVKRLLGTYPNTNDRINDAEVETIWNIANGE